MIFKAFVKFIYNFKLKKNKLSKEKNYEEKIKVKERNRKSI